MIEAIQFIILLVILWNLGMMAIKQLTNFIEGTPSCKDRDIKDINDLIDDCLERVSYIDYNGMQLKNKVFLLQNILWLASDESIDLVKKSCKDNCENRNG